jgi:hypothetical protein
MYDDRSLVYDDDDFMCDDHDCMYDHYDDDPITLMMTMMQSL